MSTESGSSASDQRLQDAMSSLEMAYSQSPEASSDLVVCVSLFLNATLHFRAFLDARPAPTHL